jgi:hypothetical protein
MSWTRSSENTDTMSMYTPVYLHHSQGGWGVAAFRASRPFENSAKNSLNEGLNRWCGYADDSCVDFDLRPKGKPCVRVNVTYIS